MQTTKRNAASLIFIFIPLLSVRSREILAQDLGERSASSTFFLLGVRSYQLPTSYLPTAAMAWLTESESAAVVFLLPREPPKMKLTTVCALAAT